MRDGSKTKAKIEQSAMRLFVDKGVAETTIRDIAGAVGIAEGTIYRHYDSKDDMVWELFSTHYSAFAETLRELQAGEAVLRDKLEAMVGGFCRLFDSDRVLFSFLMIVQHQQLRKLTPDIANPVDVLYGVIRDAMDRGEIPAGNADVATAMVMGIVVRTAIFNLYGRIDEPLGELSPVLSGACWRALNA